MGTLDTPATATQNAAILAWLQAGNSITPTEALRAFSCFRLAARIYDLRCAGHDIVTYWEAAPTGRKRWARYVLLQTARPRRAA